MSSREYFILGFTFFVGAFCGAYLYATSFAPSYEKDTVEDVTTVAFQVRGETYGGCQRSGACAAFVLNENRSFEFTPGQVRTEISSEPEVVKGKLPVDDYNRIVTIATTANYSQLQKKGGACVSEVDGTDYFYQIVLDGTAYSLDTCGTAFSTSVLASELGILWTKFASPDTPAEGGFPEAGVGGLLQDALDKRFEYDNQ